MIPELAKSGAQLDFSVQTASNMRVEQSKTGVLQVWTNQFLYLLGTTPSHYLPPKTKELAKNNVMMVTFAQAMVNA